MYYKTNNKVKSIKAHTKPTSQSLVLHPGMQVRVGRVVLFVPRRIRHHKLARARHDCLKVFPRRVLVGEVVAVAQDVWGVVTRHHGHVQCTQNAKRNRGRMLARQDDGRVVKARLATRVLHQLAEARCVKVRSVKVEDDQRFLLVKLVLVGDGAEFRVKRLVVKLHESVRANQVGVAFDAVREHDCLVVLLRHVFDERLETSSFAGTFGTEHTNRATRQNVGDDRHDGVAVVVVVVAVGDLTTQARFNPFVG